MPPYFWECGNTEAEGFLCRFHLAFKKFYDEKRISRGERSVRFSGKRLYEAELPQGKGMKAARGCIFALHKTAQDESFKGPISEGLARAARLGELREPTISFPPTLRATPSMRGALNLTPASAYY